MYNYYIYRGDNNGSSGILLTAVLAIILSSLGLFFMYHYIQHLHFNGRMLDLYHRLTGTGMNFYLPEDFEISLRVLSYIVDRAKEYKGIHGHTRQMSVTAYKTLDHLDTSFCEQQYHISIYTVEKQNEQQTSLETPKRTMYRHFLRNADGTILELFEEEEDVSLIQYRLKEERLLNSGSSVEQLQAIRKEALGRMFQDIKEKVNDIRDKEQKKSMRKEQLKREQLAQAMHRAARQRAEEEESDEEAEDTDEESTGEVAAAAKQDYVRQLLGAGASAPSVQSRGSDEKHSKVSFQHDQVDVSAGLNEKMEDTGKGDEPSRSSNEGDDSAPLLGRQVTGRMLSLQ
jgi:hypothetical protein